MNGQEFAMFGVSLVFQTAVRGYEQNLVETTSVTERNQWFRLTSAVPFGEGADIETTIWQWKHNPGTQLENSCIKMGVHNIAWKTKKTERHSDIRDQHPGHPKPRKRGR